MPYRTLRRLPHGHGLLLQLRLAPLVRLHLPLVLENRNAVGGGLRLTRTCHVLGVPALHHLGHHLHGQSFVLLGWDHGEHNVHPVRGMPQRPPLTVRLVSKALAVDLREVLHNGVLHGLQGGALLHGEENHVPQGAQKHAVFVQTCHVQIYHIGQLEHLQVRCGVHVHRNSAHRLFDGPLELLQALPLLRGKSVVLHEVDHFQELGPKMAGPFGGK
mmetsp:Transcript_26053/g.57691  ORF Transcript_26053/g.57691 Transcript_26053/m.57691 type:complete len:216 (+) Transcript_26053:1090-1737(+)